MLGSFPSSKFTSIYDSLPADAQQALVEKHLIPLLNVVEKGRSKKVLAHASRLKKRHAGIPSLDLRSKTMEINALLDELHRDAKRSFVKERSQRNELLNEAVDSLTNWLNDIWSVVYEYNVNFVHAHKCLLFVAGTLDHIASGRSSCKCSFTNMFVNVVIKNKTGKRVKSFDLNGAHNVEEALHFIWRDLFLSMLAAGNKRDTNRIPEMLEEIDDLLGWTALERVLYGGKKCPHDFDEDDEDDDEDWESDYGSEPDDDEEFGDDMPSGPEHARHWSYRISNQMWPLRKHIQAALLAIFKLTPSQQLYHALCAISINPLSIQDQLLTHLKSIGTSCSETFAAALDIYACESDTDSIMRLLNSHSHLLRPRDAPSLQAAVTVIGQSPFYQQRGLQILEKELMDTARTLRAALLVSFSQLDQPANNEEIQRIIRTRQGAAGRQDRVESWVDAVSTPGANAPNPMAFAAMIMGLPIVPGMDATEEADPLGYLDLDPNDPDLEDLREEFRPRLKQRFEGWQEVAALIKGGPLVLLNVYKEIVQLMPFLRATDVVDEMVGRLADRPSKHYICDGLDSLMHFIKQQKKKISFRLAQRRKPERTTAGGAGPSSGAAPPVLPAGLPAFLFGGVSRHGSGGLEDVD